MNELEAKIILPFRANIQPSEIVGIIPGDSDATQFKLNYHDYVELFPDASGNMTASGNTQESRIPLKRLNTEIFTCINIKIPFSFPTTIKSNERKQWLFHNCSYILSDYIIPRLEHILFHLKKSFPHLLDTGTIRNIGEIDILFYTLRYNDEPVICARASSSFFHIFGLKGHPFPEDISRLLSSEWLILTRAVDLVNHGYSFEAFLTGFALLDRMVQKFIKERLPLNSDESKKFLRCIEHKRLLTFLGPLMKIVIGVSLLDEIEGSEIDIKELNEKRNNFIHNCRKCTRSEAKHCLRSVLKYMKYLNTKGGKYDLPDDLYFWSQEEIKQLH